MKIRAIMVPLSLCALFVFSPVRADAPPPAPPAQPRAIAAFADDKPYCLEWTDGCTVCKRLADGAAGCSTVGAACVQTAPLCTKQKTAP